MTTPNHLILESTFSNDINSFLTENFSLMIKNPIEQKPYRAHLLKLVKNNINNLQILSDFIIEKQQQQTGFITLSRKVLISCIGDLLHPMSAKKIHTSVDTDKIKYFSIQHFFSLPTSLASQVVKSTLENSSFQITINEIDSEKLEQLCKSLNTAISYANLFQSEKPLKLFLDTKKEISIQNFETLFSHLFLNTNNKINISDFTLSEIISKTKNFDNLKFNNTIYDLNLNFLTIPEKTFETFIKNFYETCKKQNSEFIFNRFLTKVFNFWLVKTSDLELVTHSANLVNELYLNFEKTKFSSLYNYDYLIQNHSEFFYKTEKITQDKWLDVILEQEKNIILKEDLTDRSLLKAEVYYKNNHIEALNINTRSLQFGEAHCIKHGFNLVRQFKLEYELRKMPINNTHSPKLNKSKI